MEPYDGNGNRCLTYPSAPPWEQPRPCAIAATAPAHRCGSRSLGNEVERVTQHCRLACFGSRAARFWTVDDIEQPGAAVVFELSVEGPAKAVEDLLHRDVLGVGAASDPAGAGLAE